MKKLIKNPTVKDIVSNYLKWCGYSGLHNDECGCSLEDLFVCGCEGVEDCKAGYRQNCKKCEQKDWEYPECDRNYKDRYCIGNKK